MGHLGIAAGFLPKRDLEIESNVLYVSEIKNETSVEKMAQDPVGELRERFLKQLGGIPTRPDEELALPSAPQAHP